MVQAVRCGSEYRNASDRYVLKDADYSENCFHRQFFLIYRERARILKARIIAAAKQKYGKDCEIQSLVNVQKRTKVLVVGVVIKCVQQRPSVLKSIAADELILPHAVIDENLLGNEDYLELEDGGQRVRLTGAVSMDDVATGCVLGFSGVLVHADVFEVDEIVLPIMVPQDPLPSFKNDKYLMFISGISVTGETSTDGDKVFCLDLLEKWLCGYLPVSAAEQNIIKNICRVIVAGESITIADQGKEYATMARYLIKTEECPNVECAAIVDKLLSKITGLIEVDLMPGAGDPATHLMPQQPIHRAVFPNASRQGDMLSLVTNPYSFSLDGVNVLGTSGQNVNDLKRFCEGSSCLRLLKNLLHWQHIAPTVPDTIDGFPFKSRDPLVIDETFPHIFFAGNQSCAEYALTEFEKGRRTLLLSIPKFSNSHSVLLVNLRTLDVIEQSFGC